MRDICQVYHSLELQQPGDLQSLKWQFTQICKFWPFLLNIIYSFNRCAVICLWKVKGEILKKDHIHHKIATH